MRVAVFSSKPYDETYLRAAAEGSGHELDFLEARLSCEQVRLAAGYPAVCVFVHDDLGARVLRALSDAGTELVALRAAGFNNVDLAVAAEVGIRVARVPAYSPYAVAEHGVALILSLVRRTHRAYNRVRDGNFALDGLLGYDLHGKSVGIVGSGRIGTVFARIMAGFGCRLLAYDPFPSDEMRALGARYVELPELFAESDIIALHAPLTPATHHLVDRETLALVKPGVLIVNTSRGGLIDTEAAIEALKDGRIGAPRASTSTRRRMRSASSGTAATTSSRTTPSPASSSSPTSSSPRTRASSRQEALQGIAATTIANLTAFERDGAPLHEVTLDAVG